MPPRKGAGVASSVLGHEDLLDPEWCARLSALRRSGDVGIVFAEAGSYYMSDYLSNAWESKKRLSVRKLKALIEQRELEKGARISVRELRTMITEIESKEQEVKENAA